MMKEKGILILILPKQFMLVEPSVRWKSGQNDLLGTHVYLFKTFYTLGETKRKLQRTSVKLSQSDPKDNVFKNTSPIRWYTAKALLGDFSSLSLASVNRSLHQKFLFHIMFYSSYQKVGK